MLTSITHTCLQAAYTLDATLTQLIPGIILDTFAPIQPNEYQDLAKWGIETGNKHLTSPRNLQYQYKLLYPLEYFITSKLIAARKTYYHASSAQIASTAQVHLWDTVKTKIFGTQNGSRESVAFQTFQKNTKQIIAKDIHRTSYSDLFFRIFSPRKIVSQGYRSHPHRFGAYSFSWLVRFGAFYYFMPIENRFYATAMAAASVVLWSGLLTTGARKEIVALQPSLSSSTFKLSSSAIDAIVSEVTTTFKNQIKTAPLKEELSTISVEISFNNPFIIEKTQEDWKEEFESYRKQLRGCKKDSLAYYQNQYMMLRAKINYYSMSQRQTKEIEDRCRTTILEWSKKNKEDAVTFITNVTKEERTEVQQMIDALLNTHPKKPLTTT